MLTPGYRACQREKGTLELRIFAFQPQRKVCDGGVGWMRRELMNERWKINFGPPVKTGKIGRRTQSKN